MVEEKLFCVSCGIRIKKPGAVDLIGGGKKIHEFKDGFRCDECGTAKINKARGK